MPEPALVRRRDRPAALALIALGIATCVYPVVFAPAGGEGDASLPRAIWWVIIGLPAWLAGLAAVVGGSVSLGGRSWGRGLGFLSGLAITLGAGYVATRWAASSTPDHVYMPAPFAAALAGAALLTVVLQVSRDWRPLEVAFALPVAFAVPVLIVAGTYIAHVFGGFRNTSPPYISSH